MNKLLPQVALLVSLIAVMAQTANAQSTPSCSNLSWDQLIISQAEHESCSRPVGADSRSHFTTMWLTTDSWNGNEGYMRWRVTRTIGEDDDGYAFNHPPTTSRPIFISFVARVGPTWWASHNEGFKFVMFYPQTWANPRPTIFSMRITDSGNTYRYRTFGPDLEAGGSGVDEFGRGNNSSFLGYPNHRYKEDASGHSQWYFIVMSLESDRTKTYIWSQDGTISGLYAESLPAGPAQLSSWNAQTWRTVRLLGYIEATTAGDAGAYMDIGRIRLTQSLPSPPAGFVTGGAPRPGAPTNIRVD